jgi:hypothetical protein
MYDSDVTLMGSGGGIPSFSCKALLFEDFWLKADIVWVNLVNK